MHQSLRNCRLPHLLLAAMVMVGCASGTKLKTDARPFAVLYGARQAQWLSDYETTFSVLKRSNGIDFHETEITGFRQLDADNQKRYMVVRFCTHQGGNAEDGSQMLRLLSALKCSKGELVRFIRSLDRKELGRYASALHGSIEQFDGNAEHYLR